MLRSHATLVPIFSLLAMGVVYMVSSQLMPELIEKLQAEKMPEAMRAVLFPTDPEVLPEELEFPPGDDGPASNDVDSSAKVAMSVSA